MNWLSVDGCGCEMCRDAAERILRDRSLLARHRKEFREPLEREYQGLLDRLDEKPTPKINLQEFSK